MSPLRAAIVDDEPLARARMRRLLHSVGGGLVDVVAECVDVQELLATAGSTPLDVLFLDIEMPGGDGFTALDGWQGPRPQVVFVTAYAEHGVRAFDQRATDYLLKPVSAERLRDTLSRLTMPGAVSGVSSDPVANPTRIPLAIGSRTHLVATDQIDLVLAQANYLEVHAGGARYVIRSTLAHFLARLPRGEFQRVHRSAVVRIAAVREIRPLGSGRFRIGLQGGQEVQTGRNYRTPIAALKSGIP